VHSAHVGGAADGIKLTAIQRSDDAVNGTFNEVGSFKG
jgi:hypothetical protein